jgi:hypothetical protein
VQSKKTAEVSARVQLFKKFVTERGGVGRGCRNFSAKKAENTADASF